MTKKVKIIKAKKKPRQGWDAFFKLMRTRGEDRLLIPDILDVYLKPKKLYQSIREKRCEKPHEVK